MEEEKQSEEILSEDEKVKALNEETEALNKAIAENENAKAKAKLGGVSVGHPQTEEVKEETAVEYKNRVLSGEI